MDRPQKPHHNTMILYSMMASPGNNKRIRLYIEDLEAYVQHLESTIKTMEQQIKVLQDAYAIWQQANDDNDMTFELWLNLQAELKRFWHKQGMRSRRGARHTSDS